MESDIVARLRDCDGGYGFRSVVREAADEIERLRRDYSCICGEMRRMMDERDEARREVCSMNETGLRMNESDKKREAKRRGWDCFKENTDGH